MAHRPTTSRRGLGVLALALVLAACSGGDRAAETTDSELQAPLPDVAAPEGSAETAAGGSTGAGHAEPSNQRETRVAASGDEAPLTEPLPPTPADVVEPMPPLEQPWVVNPWQDADADPRSTFGLDVDTVSYGRIREAVEAGQPVDPAEVRVEEVVNALHYGYGTDPDEVFAVTADGAAWRWGRQPGTHLLRVGLATPPADVRDPVDLVFVIDASGSMATAMPMVKEALGVLVDNLQPDQDRIAVVAYDSTARTVLAPTDVAHRDVVLDAIQGLHAGGSTNLGEGLALGYDQATTMTETATPDVNTRVVLLSDGIANTGVTHLEGILDRVSGGVEAGVELLTVGFGMAGFNDPLMEQLADRGDGRAVYVDTVAEAHDVFGEQLAATLQTIARQARTQVVFNPEVVASYRLLGYDNRAIADDDFRDDTVDAGEIGAGHTVTALYELHLHEAAVRTDGSQEVARVNLRWLDPDDRDAHETATSVTVSDISLGWESASAGLRLAGTAAAWAEVLRQSPYASAQSPTALADEARRIATTVGTPELAEWANLVARSAEA